MLFFLVFSLGWVKGAPSLAKDKASKAVKSQKKIEGGGGRELFEVHCKVCHSLDLPKAQKLDEKGWRWVMDDMVNEFGMDWLSKDQQNLIVEHLAKVYGPEKKKKPLR